MRKSPGQTNVIKMCFVFGSKWASLKQHHHHLHTQWTNLITAQSPFFPRLFFFPMGQSPQTRKQRKGKKTRVIIPMRYHELSVLPLTPAETLKTRKLRFLERRVKARLGFQIESCFEPENKTMSFWGMYFNQFPVTETNCCHPFMLYSIFLTCLAAQKSWGNCLIRNRISPSFFVCLFVVKFGMLILR